MDYAAHIADALQKEIRSFPPSFYGSFQYTVTGKNWTHPVTIGILASILSRMPDVRCVAHDLRLNENRIKFQPDLTALKSLVPAVPMLFVDYESPNSCDTRIPTKDVEAYLRWSGASKSRVPYVIITTLPKRPCKWELRYASKGKENARYLHRKQDICQNPFLFWYDDYRGSLQGKNLYGISFLNIDGKNVEVVSGQVMKLGGR